MDGLTLGLAIATGVMLIVGISLWLLFSVFFKGMQKFGQQRLHERFTDDQILQSETTANFFGFQSRGRGQIRGNGVLALTREELWFSQFITREEIRIPLVEIQAVSLVDSHLGKRVLGRQELKVEFQTATGTTDAAAWLVGDPNSWKTAIESAMRAKTSW
ncbi:hypothetical protein F7734_28530 [Scytonema sp. UIC 10036]|uniref:hypothetical protein n=1 Tax=Scytonema sp. UIC 10036 TaxID=2304196 RepID=UPI0012DA6E1C|nr:hypothetical protein [Scytonema sp. UIC 10036]MUG96076.1 hypothetical protein [Scytonema sp. UIC 10036]